MDAYEATKIVFQRIQTLDPQNAAKIMGVLLIQDHGEKEMIRLAFGPESLLQSLILKAKKELSLSSSPAPFCNSSSSPLSRQNSCPNPPPRLNLPSPLSISTWNSSDFQNPDDLISPVGGYTCNTSPSPSTMNSAAAPFYGSGEIDLIDELNLQDQLSFLNDGGSSQIGQKNPDFYYPHHQDLALSPTWGGGAAPNGLPHRRSYSVSDIYLGADDGSCGLGWKPCLFYARGYCKNGTSCRFLHGGDAAVEELLRTKPTQQQQQLIGSPNSNFAYSPLSAAANKCFNLLDSPRSLMMGDGMPKFGRGRNGEFGINPGSRQIYLTFPADSTFKEEDVSNYFSNFGPVQDVRIPYQQKRMFGFVTFEYPETVKMILAKGNPHFVCDARVLVKPYKEKGKISEKHRKQQQQMERGEFGNSAGIESRDPYDIHLGSRMFHGAPDILWRRKLEEADMQQTIELQNRRFMGLQLLDVKRNSHQCGLSNGAVISSPTYSPTSFFSLNVMSSNQSSPDAKEENGANPGDALQPPANVIEKDLVENKIVKERPPKDSESSDHHNLPDSPFASPEAAGAFSSAFLNTTTLESDKSSVIVSNPLTNNNFTDGPALFRTTSLDMSPFKSCYFQVPRFASGRETVGM